MEDLYYAHFGLKDPPFKITPNTDFFFSGGNRGAVLDALIYAISNGEGIIKVVGEVGSGKTMLCRMLQNNLPEKIESIYLANPSVAPEDVLHAIAFELQLKLPKNADRLKVMQLLQAHLLNRHAEGRQVVIFIEEAQGMPLATLEEIRLLSNLETKQDKLLQIVLFGQPELDIQLGQAHIRQLRERITHSFHLAPLTTQDVEDYLMSRLRAAGYHGPHLFSKSAIKILSKAAKGLVRRVNILADKSLLAAFADNVYQVTPKHVKAAIQDSEFGQDCENSKRFWILATIFMVFLLATGSYFWMQYQSKTQPKVSIKQHENQAVASQVAKVVQPKQTINHVAKLSDARQQLLGQRFDVTKSWLFNAQANAVTIEITAMPEDVRLSDGAKYDAKLMAEFDAISQQLEVDNLYLYRKKQNGEIFNVILYGDFTERNQALISLQNMPTSVKEYRPQLRTVAGVIKDAEQTQ